jgi:hypothetical protein
MQRLPQISFATALLALTGTPALAQDPPPAEAEVDVEVDVETDPNVPPPTVDTDATATVDPEATMTGMYTKETWPLALTARPITLAKGMLEIHADVFINLSTDRVGEPIGLAPDVYYGISDRLSVGLLHNIGICVTGEDSGCAEVYNDFALDALFSFKRDARLDVAVHAGLDALTIDPFALALRAGVLLKFMSGKIAFYADPFIRVGLTEREGDAVPSAVAMANEEAIAIPLTVAFQATPQLAVFATTGLSGLTLGTMPGAAPLSDIGDFFAIPLGIGALYAISNRLDAGAFFNLPVLAGGDAFEGFAGTDLRTLTIFANIRL